MPRKAPTPRILLSLPFVVALVVLLVNDHLLKAHFGNLVTGKLSDIAGLFAFAVVFSVLSRRTTWSHLGTALAFVLWKSPLADPLISAFNALPLRAISRVVDYTDLLALGVLPFSWALCAKWRPRTAVGWRPAFERVAIPLSMVVSFFAFSATSMRKDPMKKGGIRFERRLPFSKKLVMGAIDKVVDQDGHDVGRVTSEKGRQKVSIRLRVQDQIFFRIWYRLIWMDVQLTEACQGERCVTTLRFPLFHASVNEGEFERRLDHFVAHLSRILYAARDKVHIRPVKRGIEKQYTDADILAAIPATPWHRTINGGWFLNPALAYAFGRSHAMAGSLGLEYMPTPRKGEVDYPLVMLGANVSGRYEKGVPYVTSSAEVLFEFIWLMGGSVGYTWSTEEKGMNYGLFMGYAWGTWTRWVLIPYYRLTFFAGRRIHEGGLMFKYNLSNHAR